MTKEAIRHYDYKKLEEISFGDKDFMNTLVDIFLSNTPAECASMVKSASEENWKEVSRLAHKIKSTVYSIDIAPIRDLIKETELNAKNETNLDKIPKDVDFIHQIIQETAEQLKRDFK